MSSPKKYRERSRNNEISKDKNHISKEEQAKKTKQINNLVKYKPGKGPQGPKKMNLKDILKLKEPIGNTILLEAGTKDILFNLFNCNIIGILPQSQKHAFQVLREGPKKCFFNLTNLSTETMESIEKVIRDSTELENNEVSIKIIYNNTNIGKENLSNKINSNSLTNIENNSLILKEKLQMKKKYDSIIIGNIFHLNENDLINICEQFGSIEESTFNLNEVSLVLNLTSTILF